MKACSILLLLLAGCAAVPRAAAPVAAVAPVAQAGVAFDRQGERGSFAEAAGRPEDEGPVVRKRAVIDAQSDPPGSSSSRMGGVVAKETPHSWNSSGRQEYSGLRSRPPPLETAVKRYALEMTGRRIL